MNQHLTQIRSHLELAPRTATSQKLEDCMNEDNLLRTQHFVTQAHDIV